AAFSRSDSRESIAVGNRELVHCLSPLPYAAPALAHDVAQGQPDQLGSRVIAGEVPPGLDDLAQLAVQTLDGIGGVDQPAHRWREGKERDDPVPGPAPSGHHRREAL